MRRLVTSLSTQDRLSVTSEFLRSLAGEEILVIASTRIAADELVRQWCVQSGGAFGVHRFTLPQLAYLLAAEQLAATGRSFLTGVAMDALAARVVHACRMAGELTWFDPVATTPGFFRALASTISELRLNDIDPAALRTSGPSGRDLASLLEHFDRNLKESEVADLASAYKIAIAAIAEPGFRFRGRPLLLLDVVPITLLEEQFVRALSGNWGQSPLTPLPSGKGVNGDCPQFPRALDRLRQNIFEMTAPVGEMDATVEFISATDESRECVEIARSILSLAKSGIAFDQMAIVLRNPEAYQPLVEDALRRAGIPGFCTLGSRRPNPAGRALLALLACASEGLSASRFSEYLSLGQVPKIDAPSPKWIPIQGELFADPPPDSPDDEDARYIPTPYQWEKLLVDAAVIGGHDRWVRRLDGLANEFRKQISEVQAEDESTRQRLERQLDRLANLRTFALPLIEFLDQLPGLAIWSDWLEVLEQLATKSIRRPEFVLAVLAELRPMSNLGPVTLDEVREVLTHRLTFLRTDSAERRYGKVFVTTTAELAGLSFEVVFLPGLAEDIFPKRAFEDPLLLDDARRSISPWLATQSTRIARERLLLHIAAGAARSKLWISYPRVDLAQGRPRSPSFYALDVLRAITGKVPNLRELQQRSTASLQSQVGWPAPRDAATAIDDAEYDLAVISGLLRVSREEASGRARYLLTANPSLARSLRARSGRWKRKWTDGDGIVPAPFVTDALVAHRLGGRPYSATALQQFAACPYRFALYSIHRLQPRLETVAIERLDALTRGSLFHTTQFRLLSELRELGMLPITPDNLSSVLPIADRVFDEIADRYREDLAPAIPRIWESQIEDIRWDLRGWLREMSHSTGWTPAWFELSFGLPPARGKDPASSPDPVPLPNGLLLRGAIDMIEGNWGQSPITPFPNEKGVNGDCPQLPQFTLRITDHKTGKAPPQRPGLTGQGEVLQPILYALAAEAILGKPATSARLFYCTERGGYQSFEIPIDDHARESIAKVLKLIDRSITSGFLPAAPREQACVYCDYRSVCGPYEETRIRRKSADPLTLLSELREIP